MAILAATVWQLDAGGSINNGGGYDGTNYPGGTDYSQNTTAALALTDLACANNTTLTSATGGFTAQMVGNAIAIRSGTNFTAGYYFITAWASTNSVTLDRNPTTGSSASAGNGNVGGASSTFKSASLAIGTAMVAGNTVHVKSGNYSCSANVTLTAGTAAAPITIIGFKTNRNDACNGTDRPIFDGSTTVTITIGNYKRIRNMRFTSAVVGGNTIVAGTYEWFHNCYFANTAASATSNAISDASNTYNLFTHCELTVTTGRSINTCCATFKSCYIHGGASGILTAASSQIFGSVISGCSAKGLDFGSGAGQCTIEHSVVYGCGIGIDCQNQPSNRIVNNIISACTTGISATSVTTTNVSDYNVMNNNTNYTNVTAGPHDIVADPLLTNPGAGDFTRQATSPAIGAATQLDTAVGVVGRYNWNIGADQTDLPSGSSFVG